MWLECYDNFSKINDNGLFCQDYCFINKVFPYLKSNTNVSIVVLNVDYISLHLKQRTPNAWAIIVANAGGRACNDEMNMFWLK